MPAVSVAGAGVFRTCVVSQSKWIFQWFLLYWVRLSAAGGPELRNDVTEPQLGRCSDAKPAGLFLY